MTSSSARIAWTVGLVAVLLAVVVAFVLLRPAPTGGPTATGRGEAAVLVGAGDIAECPTEFDEATAAIIEDVIGDHPDAVVYTTGDNAYQDGSYEEYIECYEPSWGRFKDRTRPAVGNHEFKQTQAEGYHRYWGERGGPFDQYYYSFDAGDWHVVVLNSECHRVGCELGSDDGEQAEWLVEDLESSDARCTLAIWHNPRWSSGRYGNDDEYDPLWEILHDHGAELVLNGHEHLYERFEPMTPSGERDNEEGIRQFTVGTGGGNLRDFRDLAENSAERASVHGVLKLTLHADRYDWEFLAVEGENYTDSGSAACH